LADREGLPEHTDAETGAHTNCGEKKKRAREKIAGVKMDHGSNEAHEICEDCGSPLDECTCEEDEREEEDDGR
jgi:hypothetical protein